MNKICLIGRLVRDVELRVNERGTKQSTLTLAVNRPFKNAEGEYETDFINCVAWQKLAETINEYCHKGDQLGIEGRLQIDSIIGADGNNKYFTNVIIENITFIQAKQHNKEEDIKENKEIKKDPFEEFGEEITDDMLPF